MVMNQYQTGYNGNSDVFITKLDTIQSGIGSLLYSTYLGGNSTVTTDRDIKVTAIFGKEGD